MQSNGDDLIAVRLRSKRFDGAGGPREILRDISFNLKRRDTVALMGPSGAGKTTLLRIMAGLDTCDEGSVLHASGETIGMVFQEPRLLPWRDVETNIRIAAPSIDENRLRKLLGDLRLEAHRRHYPRELSLGLARRVALARALAIEPSVLILDEPFASLDPALALALRSDLSALLAREGVTAIVTTHNPEEAVSLASRFLVIGGAPATIQAELTAEGAQRDRLLEQIKNCLGVTSDSPPR